MDLCAYSYELVDQPSRSGSLSIDSTTGVLAGVLTTVDLNFQQPMPVILRATDGIETVCSARLVEFWWFVIASFIDFQC